MFPGHTSWGTHCNTLQHTATRCNTLQHTATHFTVELTRENTATRCNTRQYAATHCNTLQHTAIHCNTLLHTLLWSWLVIISTHRLLGIHTAYVFFVIHICSTHWLFRIHTHCVCVCAGGLLKYCSVLQCVAVCCSVLQCVAACCSVLIPWHDVSRYFCIPLTWVDVFP